jgi:RNA polymerase sigma-70 factor (ECF subfamily)
MAIERRSGDGAADIDVPSLSVMSIVRLVGMFCTPTAAIAKAAHCGEDIGHRERRVLHAVAAVVLSEDVDLRVLEEGAARLVVGELDSRCWIPHDDGTKARPVGLVDGHVGGVELHLPIALEPEHVLQPQKSRAHGLEVGRHVVEADEAEGGIKDDPADIVQESWLEVARRFPQWCAQDALPVHVWLRLVTSHTLAHAHRRNLAAHMRDALREVASPAPRPSVSAASVAEAFVANATTPTQAVQREEVRARVLAALEELDELDREIVALRHFEGLSNEEAAAELAIEPAAASKRFARALLRLRPALQSLAQGVSGESGERV